MNLRVIATLLAGCMLAGQAGADAMHSFDRCRAPGTWVVNVAFDNGLQFQELLTLHRGGTLTETNGGLHASSFPDPNAIPSEFGPPPFNGSDGHGTWRYLKDCRIQWSFVKLLFSGANTPVAGLHVGYLRVRSVAKIVGNQYMSMPQSTVTELVFGPDPRTENPMFVQNFGPSVSVGSRWLTTD